MSLVVARKQALSGSPPASDKPTSSVSPRRETGSPRIDRKGPPVAKKPVRESISETQQPGSPRKAESPQLTKKTFESVPSVGALTGSVPTGSPVASRREPVQPQAFEPVVQIVQQSPREAARKFCNSLAHFDCVTKPVSGLPFTRNLVIYEVFSWLCFVYSCFANINPAAKSPYHTDHSRSRMCDRDSQRQHGPGAEHSWRCRYAAGKLHSRYIIVLM